MNLPVNSLIHVLEVLQRTVDFGYDWLRDIGGHQTQDERNTLLILAEAQNLFVKAHKQEIIDLALERTLMALRSHLATSVETAELIEKLLEEFE